jgi:hypothetical protein
MASIAHWWSFSFLSGGARVQAQSKPIYLNFTVKKAVELLDAPSKNTFLKSNKYDSIVEIVYLDTHVFLSPLCNRMRKFDIREVQKFYTNTELRPTFSTMKNCEKMWNKFDSERGVPPSTSSSNIYWSISASCRQR